MQRGRLTLLTMITAVGFVVAVPSGGAAQSCWQQLLHDWADGRISGSYPVSCYRQALARMPEDLEAYSSAPDDIEAALQRQVHRVGSRSLAVSTSSQRSELSPSRFGVLGVVGLAGGLALVLGAALALVVRKTRRI